ncbi:uncharacterized protein AKAME5_002489300 [Lates japonicus]|uniref:Uncharacterized protein n=1 Tax=Lates japonicus TaxID=270547 RepID=A0AAD3NJE4_LATJO|nr:uncharacterized protein AKAME5_002489300 [Lates japonicus]
MPLKRKRSKELPHNLSELMKRLAEHKASFIKLFDGSKDRMRHIVGEFHKIAADVREMQEKTDKTRAAGAVATGLALTAGLVAAPLTEGASLLAAGAGAAVGGGGGAVAVVHANITKMMVENGSAQEVEKLGKEFMTIVEPMKKELTEIKTTCEMLEEKSAESQAKKTLTGMEEFQRTQTQVSELQEMNKGVLDGVSAVMRTVAELLKLIVKVFTVKATPEEDETFRSSIVQFADQCQKVIDDCENMKKNSRGLMSQYL